MVLILRSCPINIRNNTWQKNSNNRLSLSRVNQRCMRRQAHPFLCVGYNLAWMTVAQEFLSLLADCNPYKTNRGPNTTSMYCFCFIYGVYVYRDRYLNAWCLPGHGVSCKYVSCTECLFGCFFNTSCRDHQQLTIWAEKLADMVC